MADDGQSWHVRLVTMDETDITVLTNVVNDFKESIEQLFGQTGTGNDYSSETFNVGKGVNLSAILKRLSDLRLPSNSERKHIPDTWNHISVLSKSLQEYLQLLEEHQKQVIADRIYSDSQTWLSELFSLDNLQSSFHHKEFDGLVKVCKLALHSKYPKYESDGFTALYTRPPVIYISSAAPPEFSKQLQNQLGLPQSSVCFVPCNTMFGSPFTMDVSALERLLTDDVSCGKTPLILIAYAGTPLTGHTDNLSRLREICTQSGVWFHVEGDTLANLALSQMQPSIQVAASADSLTLNLSRWFGISSLPYCTYFRCNNVGQAQLSGLIPDVSEKLIILCVWVMIQFMGIHDLQNIIEHSSGLAQQMTARLDIVNGVKRIEQPSGLSPVVIFKYKASPNLPLTLEDTEEKGALLLAAPRGKIEVSEPLTDSFNKKICEILKTESSTVQIETVEIPREGLCLKFDPLQTSRKNGTSKVDVDNYIENLQNKIIMMDYMLVSRDTFKDFFSKMEDVNIIETAEQPIMGAFQCIPKYWKTKSMSNLSDLKKQEANGLNLRVYQALSTKYQNVLSLNSQEESGLNVIELGAVGESFNLQLFSELVNKLALEFEDNAKFVESVSGSIQKNIEEAQQKLTREQEEKFFQNGVLRSVPVVASFYNWFSPPPKEDHGVTGRSFDLSSGKLDSTDKIYKFKMQIRDDQSDRLSNASDISKGSSALETSSLKDDDDVNQTSTLENESDVTNDVTFPLSVVEGSTAETTTELAQEAGKEGDEDDEVKESDV